MLHAVAIAVTFVAVTSGFGSVVAARYDARRAARGEMRTPDASSLPGMALAKTPTPVGGVAAARPADPTAFADTVIMRLTLRGWSMQP